jgi:hypothetical protein
MDTVTPPDDGQYGFNLKYYAPGLKTAPSSACTS